MRAFVLLFFAIIAEIIATSALKLSDGFSKLAPSIVVLIGYFAAFYMMALTLKTLPLGIVYAIWSGLGIVGIACIGVVWYGESFGLWHFVGTGLILIGVVILSLLKG